jgi:hypothetical protein
VVVSISSLSIRGGHAPDSSVATGASGGGILNRGALRLSNVTVSHNVAGAGGSPIGLLPGAGGNGGGIDNLGSLTLVGSSIVKNRTGGGGVSAGINAPSGNGGGVYMASSAIATIIKRSVIKKNVAAPATGLIGGAGDGGGIFNASSATIVPRATRIVRNSPDNCAPAGTVSRCRH